MPLIQNKTPEAADQAPRKVEQMAARLSKDLFFEFVANHPEIEAKLFENRSAEEEDQVTERAIGVIQGKVLSFMERNEHLLKGFIAAAKQEERVEVRILIKDVLKEIVREIVDGVCSTIVKESEGKIDDLTQLPNRRAFKEKLKEEVARESRNGPFSLLIIDLDHFKKVNDTYGHLAGDEVLRKVGEAFERVRRTSDFYARYGGEEFVVILTNTELEKAYLAAKRISDEINQLVVDAVDEKGNAVQIPVSASIGGAVFRGYKNDPTGRGVVEAADVNLYVLKGLKPDVNGKTENRRGMIAFGREIISKKRIETVEMRLRVTDSLRQAELNGNKVKSLLDKRAG